MTDGLLQIEFPIEQLQAWIERARNKPKEFFVEWIQDLNEAVVMNTPYKTGNLRGSWYAGLDAPDEREGPPDGGGGAVARMNAVLAGIELGQTYYAANGASYAAFVEYGTSRMAPRAFVRGALEQAGALGEAAAQRVGSTE